MVERDSPSPDSTKPASRVPGILLTASLLFALPQMVLAATWRVGCDEVARDLKSVTAPVASLPLDNVEHMSEHHGAVDPATGAIDNVTAPLLFLTPRVAHILEDVFGDSDQPGSELTAMERVRRLMTAASASAKATTEAAAQPTGGGADGTDKVSTNFEAAILSGASTETFYDVDTLPRFQRQMYRTDI